MKNFTKILFTFLLIIASHQVLKAQDAFYYEGAIDGNLKIQMYLNYDGQEEIAGVMYDLYKGWYYYESQDKNNKLNLSGVLRFT